MNFDKIDDQDLKKKVDTLFHENLNLVNYKLKKQFNTVIRDYSELEQELMCILYKACLGWFKNEIFLRGTEGHKYKTATTFSYHYYGYVMSYMSLLNKKNKKDNFVEIDTCGTIYDDDFHIMDKEEFQSKSKNLNLDVVDYDLDF